jgi:hypothetical protein
MSVSERRREFLRMTGFQGLACGITASQLTVLGE